MGAVDQTEHPPRRKPAPGRLALVQRFVNTVDIEEGTEELGDPASASAWLRGQGLLDGDDVDHDGLAALVEVREALRAMALANNGDELDDAVVATLTRHGRRATVAVLVDPTGSADLVPSAGGTDGAIAALLAAVHDATVDGTWPRFKACRDHTCAWAFYDHSKNRSSAWCEMAVCGNRAKARSYRRRHADA